MVLPLSEIYYFPNHQKHQQKYKIMLQTQMINYGSDLQL